MDADSDSVSDEILRSRDELLGFIRSRGVAPDDAEDILQESLLRALDQQDSLRDHDSLVAWLYQIVRNAMADHFRRKGRQADVGLPDELAVGSDDYRMVCSCIETLIPKLPPSYAEVITALDLQGESSTSLAARLGITRNALKVRSHRARASLRDRLMETCRTCAEHGCLDCACRQSASS